jgi:hypothetical protein
LRIRFNIIGIISAAVSTAIAIGVGVYSFGGFPQQLANNLPLPDNPLTPNFQNDDTDASPDSPNIDPIAVSRLMAEEGLDQDTASLIAQIDTQVKSYDNTYLTYEQTLPGKQALDAQITAIPDQTYAPTEAEIQEAAATGSEVYGVEYYFEEIGGVPQFTLRYFVPYEAMPEELKASIQSSDSVSPTSAPVGLLPAAEASDSASGAVFETVIKGIVKEGLGQVSDKFGPILSALGTAIDLAKIKDSRSYFSELDSLEDCANNPTNPLTKKTFEENPEEKQKTLDALKEARSEVTEITAVRGLNLAAKTGAKFTGANAAGKIFFDSVAKWNDKTLEQVSERWVDDARKAVVKCDPPATQLNGSIQYRVSYSQKSLSDNCNSYQACWEQNEQASGGGTFFVKVMPSGISGNGTGSYEHTRTRVITGTPQHPLTEYDGEWNYVRSGDVQIIVQGSLTYNSLYVNGAGNMIEEGSATTYVVQPGASKATPVTHARHIDTTGGFVCDFKDVDFVNGGKYHQDIVWGGTVAGSCDVELLPG